MAMTQAQASQAQASQKLGQQDPILADLIAQVDSRHPLKALPRRRPDFFTTVVRTIADQQLSIKAAATIWQRVMDSHGQATPESWRLLAPEDLRACGLSMAKARAIIANAELFAEGQWSLPNPSKMRHMSNDTLEEQLIALPGIGPWSAQMLMMFALRRPDVWSPGDAGLRRAMRQAYALNAEAYQAQQQTISDRWRPYRTLACRYLWASLTVINAND